MSREESGRICTHVTTVRVKVYYKQQLAVLIELPEYKSIILSFFLGGGMIDRYTSK